MSQRVVLFLLENNTHSLLTTDVRLRLKNLNKKYLKELPQIKHLHMPAQLYSFGNLISGFRFLCKIQMK